MKLNEHAGRRINIISSIAWSFIAAILAVIFFYSHDLSESFYKLVLALLITIVLINIAGILSYLHKKRKLDIVNWAIFQSAILILALFADRFPIADRKAFWLGVVAVCALYATTRLSSAWLFKKFDDIEKL